MMDLSFLKDVKLEVVKKATPKEVNEEVGDTGFDDSSSGGDSVFDNTLLIYIFQLPMLSIVQQKCIHSSLNRFVNSFNLTK